MPRPPLIFIPGLGGSFNLPVLLDWRAPTLSGWNFPPFVDYGQAFVNGCVSAGYTRDRDLFVAFYDWRKSVADSARDYLVPWIDLARSRSGSASVVLVGHSMGGLVARSYVQGSSYRGDVARLITLGTPHRGSAEAYNTWEGGEITWGPVATAVLNVYLWYLAHLHPFATNLNRVKTIRTQVLGARDLLPIDDYLLSQSTPPSSLSEDQMSERNEWVELLNTPSGMATLLARTPISTITGAGFVTLQKIVVGPPPAPPEDPPRYPDGTPVRQVTDGQGDGTVSLASAQLPGGPRVRNLPPVQVVHDALPDQAVGTLLAELNVAVPAFASAAPATTRLVFMTASPIEMTVELPAAPAAPGVLGDVEAGATRRRRRRMRARNYGHRGKHLNMLIVEQPTAGIYPVQLRGTATGTFALGALLVGPTGSAVLGAEEAGPAPAAASAITTAHGAVADGTVLHYQVIVAADVAPQIQLDAEATTRDALSRINAAAAPATGVLGADGAPAPGVAAVLSESAAPDELRAALTAALETADTEAQHAAVELVGAAPSADAALLLTRIAERVVGPHDPALAAALVQQLRQIADAKSSIER